MVPLLPHKTTLAALKSASVAQAANFSRAPRGVVAALGSGGPSGRSASSASSQAVILPISAAVKARAPPSAWTPLVIRRALAAFQPPVREPLASSEV